MPVYDLSICAADPYRVCNKAWQWNLDRIEDTDGNVVTFFYNQETNYYNARTFLRRLYVRAGNPARIEYAKRANDAGVLPTAQAEFLTQNRCTGACLWPADYPDTPGSAMRRHWHLYQELSQFLEQVETESHHHVQLGKQYLAQHQSLGPGLQLSDAAPRQ